MTCENVQAEMAKGLMLAIYVLDTCEEAWEADSV